MTDERRYSALWVFDGISVESGQSQRLNDEINRIYILSDAG
jgi:hypothetical protein